MTVSKTYSKFVTPLVYLQSLSHLSKGVKHKTTATQA